MESLKWVHEQHSVELPPLSPICWLGFKPSIDCLPPPLTHTHTFNPSPTWMGPLYPTFPQVQLSFSLFSGTVTSMTMRSHSDGHTARSLTKLIQWIILKACEYFCRHCTDEAEAATALLRVAFPSCWRTHSWLCNNGDRLATEWEIQWKVGTAFEVSTRFANADPVIQFMSSRLFSLR